MPLSPDIVDHDSALAYLSGGLTTNEPTSSRFFARTETRPDAGTGFPVGQSAAAFSDRARRGDQGKGPTSGMIAGVLTASGYRTGLYTSPHPDRVEERTADRRSTFGADEFVDLIRTIRPVVARWTSVWRRRRWEPGTDLFRGHHGRRPAVLCPAQVDVAVLEVGLGGRLDSTNVCRPVAVITSISFDHMHQLGNTLAAIAGEKAGIIKPGVPVVSGVTGHEPLDVIRQTALHHDCECYIASQHFHHRYRGTQSPTWESASAAVWPHGWV